MGPRGGIQSHVNVPAGRVTQNPARRQEKTEQNRRRCERAFVESLIAGAILHRATVLAWVVMPEHVHVIVYFEPADTDPVPAFLRRLKHPFARTVLNRWRTLNATILPRLHDTAGTARFWQPGGGYDRNVVGHEWVEKIRYIHKNPITRGLASDSVSWRWSGAAAYRRFPGAIGPPIAFDLVPTHTGELT